MITEIPRVDFPQAAKPNNIGTGEAVLVYDDLLPAIEEIERSRAERSARAWEAEPGSMEELDSVRQLALQGFIQTAGRLIETPGLGDRDLWSRRFTEASVELYGEPEKDQVTHLLSSELYFLERITGLPNFDQDQVHFLKGVYRSELFQDEGLKFVVEVSEEALIKEAIFGFGNILKDRYGYIFDLVDNDERENYSATDLLNLFNSAITLLKEREGGGWNEWDTVEKQGNTSLSVSAIKRRLNMAMNRQPATKAEAKGLLGHELLVHAHRAKNGYETDDQLGKGLPGFLDAEEGLGILVEYAITGELPDKAYDRYVDVALAIGTLNGRQFSRAELVEISFARQSLRLQLAGNWNNETAQALRQKVQIHIDRMFRGTPGDEEGTVQGVYTKDISYYEGYRMMTDYIVSELKKGLTLQEVYDRIMVGRYDPTNQQHLQYLASLGINFATNEK